MRDPAGPEPRRGRTPPRSVDLAAELLDVINEDELEEFLGSLVAETARHAGGRVPADTGRALVAVLRTTVERTLPTLTTAFGDVPASTATTLSAAETAAWVYGMELEGMSPEDRDYEIARQFVRFAQAATMQAAKTRASTPAAVHAAVAKAGRELAPGLLPPGPGAPTGSRTGPWARNGTTLELNGVQAPGS